MRHASRILRHVLIEAARAFPSIVITGPRRAGKTTLLRRTFPRAAYVLLEDPDVLARARSDPRSLVESLQPPVLFDEIQNAPELFPYIRSRIDYNPDKMGQWFFTGSQEASLMQGVTESMAGRAAVLQLMPLGCEESARVSILLGGYPEVLARPKNRDLWFSSYMQTYIERDIRAIINIRDLNTFRRFLSMIASRHGQIVNRTDLAAPLGISVPTVNQWLHALEITAQVALVQPYFENFGKRLIKSPKVYLTDSGMACHLLGIRTQAELERSPFLGVLFEGFVASEILKHQINQGRRRELYYFRDQQGLEVDFLFHSGDGTLFLVECKASRTVYPSMARPLDALRKAVGIRSIRPIVVHRTSASAPRMHFLSPGVEAMDVPDFLAGMDTPFLSTPEPGTRRSTPGKSRRPASATS
jgi:hypothetical protein